MGVEKDNSVNQELDTLDGADDLTSDGGALEEYGVWVKSGPEDIDESTDDESFTLENLPEIEGATSFLTEEEEELLGDLETDIPDESEPQPQSPEIPDFNEPEAAQETEETDESADDFDLQDLEDQDENGEDGFEFLPISEETAEKSEPGNDEVLPSLDEETFEINMGETDGEAPMEEIDLNDFDTGEEKDEESPDYTEVSLDDFLDDDAGSTEITDDQPRVHTTEEPSFTDDESEDDFFDIDLDLEEEGPGDSEEMSLSENGTEGEEDFEEISLDDFSSVEEPVDSIDDLGVDIGFDENDEELPELSVEEPETGAVIDQDEALDTTHEAKSSILRKIEDELHSIRDELASLKNELNTLKPGARFAAGAPASEEEEDERITGFFEDDEDETIALTGDELDNILNTADVTEQAGEATEGPEDELEIDLGTLSAEDEEDVEEIDFSLPDNDGTVDEADTDKADFGEMEELSLDEPEQAEEAEEIEELDLLSSPDEEGLLAGEDILPMDGEDANALEGIDAGDLIMNEEESAKLDSVETLDEGELIDEEELLKDTNLEPTAVIAPVAADEPDFADLELEDLELESLELEDPGAIDDTENDEIELDISPEDSDEMNEIIESSEAEAELPEEEFIDLGLDETEEEPADYTAETPEAIVPTAQAPTAREDLDPNLQSEIKSVLSYMDQLLEALPEEKIEEFAHSEHFKVYRKLFDELGISS